MDRKDCAKFLCQSNFEKCPVDVVYGLTLFIYLGQGSFHKSHRTQAPNTDCKDNIQWNKMGKRKLKKEKIPQRILTRC